jgi:LPXTG-motif cell wall-anchored protein
MSRLKLLVPLIVLSATLMWALPTLAQAQDPTACLTSADKTCAATNNQNLGAGKTRNGTLEAPWLVTTSDEMAARLGDMQRGLATGNYAVASYFFAEISCPSPTTTAYGTCSTTWFETDNKGNIVRLRSEPGVPPKTGVDVPMPYILAGGALLAVVLIAAGFVLRRRAQPAVV